MYRQDNILERVEYEKINNFNALALSTGNTQSGCC